MSKQGQPQTLLAAIEDLNAAFSDLRVAILNEVERGFDWLIHMRELRRKSFADE